MSDGNGRDEPSEQTTRPRGNTDMQPSALATHINPNIREDLTKFPDANRRMREHLAKKKTQSGHARD
jgi:hypothetical protein